VLRTPTRLLLAAGAVLVTVGAGAAALAAPPAPVARRPHLVDLGAFISRPSAGVDLTGLYKRLLTRRLEEHRLEFVFAHGPRAGALDLRGTITRLATTRKGGRTTVQVAVSLVAVRLPGNLLVTAADAEAHAVVDGVPSAAEEASLRADALAAAVDETFEGLRRALRLGRTR